MRYMLDTNICIYAMKNTFPDLSRKMMQVPPSEIVISSNMEEKMFDGDAMNKTMYVSYLASQSKNANGNIWCWEVCSKSL